MTSIVGVYIETTEIQKALKNDYINEFMVSKNAFWFQPHNAHSTDVFAYKWLYQTFYNEWHFEQGILLPNKKNTFVLQPQLFADNNSETLQAIQSETNVKIEFYTDSSFCFTKIKGQTALQKHWSFLLLKSPLATDFNWVFGTEEEIMAEMLLFAQA